MSTHNDAVADALIAEVAQLRAERDNAIAECVMHIDNAKALRAERDALQTQLNMWMGDYKENREIGRHQARRIRELLSRLGEPCAPDVGLPPDEVGPLREERDRLRKHLHDEHQRHIGTMDERDALAALLRRVIVCDDLHGWCGADASPLYDEIDAALAAKEVA